MFKNYFITTIRNLYRNKGITLVNVLGLSAGLGVVLIIILYLHHELTYDRSWENYNHIGRVITESKSANRQVFIPKTTYNLYEYIDDNLPEVSSSTVLFRKYFKYIKYEHNNYGRYSQSYTDENFFNVFSLDIIKGDPGRLKEPNTAVLTKKASIEIFNGQDPINKVIKIDDSDFRVVAVTENVPIKSHLEFDVLLSIYTLGEEKLQSHGNDFYTYFFLDAPLDKQAEKKICEFARTSETTGAKKETVEVDFHIQPLKRIHLYSDFSSDIAKTTDIKYVYIFSFIALFILLIGSFNFINISIARASTRLKEVGVRKINGATHRDLRIQFIGESVVITLVAFLFALILIELFIDDFSRLIGSDLAISLKGNRMWIAGGFVLSIIIGVIAGFYPAFYLSALKPVKVMKGSVTSKINKLGMQKVLVVFQFFMSLLLVSSLIGILNQNWYINNKELGFEKENILVAHYLTQKIKKKYRSVKQELLKNPNILDVTASLNVPGTKGSGTSIKPVGKSIDEALKVRANIVERNFPEFYEIDGLEEPVFYRDFANEENNILVNEKTLELLNLRESGDARVYLWGKKKRIAGVFKNFHNRSLHNKIDPVVWHQGFYDGNNQHLYNISIKARGKDLKSTVDYVKDIMLNHDPDYVFQYFFLDEFLQQKYYGNEKKQSKLILVASLLAIVISIMGLFALTTFHINQKIKDIGTRKVFGTSPMKIIWLYSWRYLWLIVISALFSLPIAHSFIKNWYENFAYHSDIYWWFYSASLIITLIIAFLTVFGKVYNAANKNPAYTLRDE